MHCCVPSILAELYMLHNLRSAAVLSTVLALLIDEA